MDHDTCTINLSCSLSSDTILAAVTAAHQLGDIIYVSGGSPLFVPKLVILHDLVKVTGEAETRPGAGMFLCLDSSMATTMICGA